MAFSPDGRRIASGAADTTVRVWDPFTVNETVTLSGHTSYVYKVAFSRDGKRIASASADKTVKVWDAQTGAETLTLVNLGGQFVGSGWRASWSPDGKKIAFGQAVWPVDPKYPALAIADLETGKTSEIAAEGKDPAWSPGDGRHIAYVAGGHGAGEELRLIGASGGTPRRLGKGGYPAWSPDGKSLYFHARDKNKLMSMDPFGEDPAGQARELISVTWWYPGIYPAGQLVASPNGPELMVVNWEDSGTPISATSPTTSL